MASKVGAALGEDRGQRIGVERHEHCGGGISGRVHRRGLFWGQEVTRRTRNIIADMAEALVIVDFQNDFAPGGALAVPEGDAIADHVNELAADPPLRARGRHA